MLTLCPKCNKLYSMPSFMVDGDICKVCQGKLSPVEYQTYLKEQHVKFCKKFYGVEDAKC